MAVDTATDDFPVKIQLPNGYTVVVLGNKTISLSQIIDKLQDKKDIRIEDISLFAKVDGTLLRSFPEQTLMNFKELERILVYGTIC